MDMEGRQAEDILFERQCNACGMLPKGN
jgi:hypothetical protein